MAVISLGVVFATVRLPRAVDHDLTTRAVDVDVGRIVVPIQTGSAGGGATGAVQVALSRKQDVTQTPSVVLTRNYV